MIGAGFQLLKQPTRFFSRLSSTTNHSGSWLLWATLIAATIPAALVMLGQTSAYLLGNVERHMAVTRGAVSLVAFTMGAMALAPALCLAIHLTARRARRAISYDQSGLAAFSIIAPGWLFAPVAAIPALLGLGPELGEWLFWGIATLTALWMSHHGSATALGITRRWNRRFTVETTVLFSLLTILLVLVPAHGIRTALGTNSTAAPDNPVDTILPTPPAPDF